MKNIFFAVAAGLIACLAGCSTGPTGLAAVGPSPDSTATATNTGVLQVFSKVVNEGGDGLPEGRKYTGYTIYDPVGQRMTHIDNTRRHRSHLPDLVALPPGKYVVKAQAKDSIWVQIPVMIDRGRTTIVHLDDNWQPPPTAAKRELVILRGQTVGWRAESSGSGSD